MQGHDTATAATRPAAATTAGGREGWKEGGMEGGNDGGREERYKSLHSLV